MEIHVPSFVLGILAGLFLVWLLRVMFRAAAAELSANMREFNAERERIEQAFAAEAERERVEQARTAEAERVRRQHEALQAIF